MDRSRLNDVKSFLKTDTSPTISLSDIVDVDHCVLCCSVHTENQCLCNYFRSKGALLVLTQS